MHFLFLILSLASPFLAMELAYSLMRVPPPRWFGDIMAAALILFGLGLITMALKSRRQSRAMIMALGSSSGPLEGGSPPLLRPLDADGLDASLSCLIHELRNYSSTLKGNTLLLRRQTLSAGMLEPLGRLERTTDKIERLARDVLASSSAFAPAELRWVCLRRLLEDCVADHFPGGKAGFEIMVDEEVPEVEADPMKLERVFINLFKNAQEAGASRIIVRALVIAHRIRILVEDNGSGCEAEQIGKLFRPLYSTRKEAGGTGLGLFMVKAILESHSGGIRAVSKNSWAGRDSGMIFCIEVPMTRSNPATQTGREPHSFEVCHLMRRQSP